jgi:hypothetical protein
MSYRHRSQVKFNWIFAVSPPRSIDTLRRDRAPGRSSLTSISRRSPVGARRRTSSPATRPGASPPTSPSCRSWCAGRRDKRGVTRLQPAHSRRSAPRPLTAQFWEYRRNALSDVMGHVRTKRRSKTGRYSITSSAESKSVCGTAIPSALTVSRLMTSSNFVGCCTGSSPGFAPLSMRSM